ncbi:MAG: PilZ domain-containing protein [Elusimicrobiota bacterium]|nr:PilZ domain-containing protein [Elusimicrobiota bacterium]
MSHRAPGLIPALVRFPGAAARQDAWGRLLELTAGGAVLSTAAPLAKGEDLTLSFELAGEELRAVPAKVLHAEPDADGQTLADLRFTDELSRRELSRRLLDALARRL